MRYLGVSVLMIGLTMSTHVLQDQQGRYDSCGSELDVHHIEEEIQNLSTANFPSLDQTSSRYCRYS